MLSPDQILGTAIEQQYRDCASILFAAMLREPYAMQGLAHRISERWFSASQYSDVAAELLAQHRARAKYSIQTLLPKSPNHDEAALLALIARHADTDLEMAVDMFEPVYRAWVEQRCALLVPSLINAGATAEEIRAAQDDFRQKSGAYMTGDESDYSEFDRWLSDKLEGFEPDYPCRPHVYCLRPLVKCFEPGSLTIIAARPSMGKTQLALNLADYFASAGHRGLFYSLEMSHTALLRRLVGMRTGINPGHSWELLSEADKQKITTVADGLKSMPTQIIDRINTLSAISSTSNSENYRRPINYIIVDYLQLVTGARIKGDTRDQEVGRISSELKGIAKRLNIAVIALAQLNRSVETRGGDKRPQMSDLRDSGNLEQDADIIIFPHRPEYYGILEDANGRRLKGTAELIVAKNRNGEVGIVDCLFDPVLGFRDADTGQFPTSEPPKHQTITMPRQEPADSVPF